MALTKVQSEMAGAGQVIQVVQGTTSTQVVNSSQTLIDTGLTATITPKYATSKILVLISHPENTKSSGNAYNDIKFNLVRNGSVLVSFNINLGYTGTAIYLTSSTSFNYLDSPASTSALTYKTQFSNFDYNGASVSTQANGTTSTITLMEIAG